MLLPACTRAMPTAAGPDAVFPHTPTYSHTLQASPTGPRTATSYPAPDETPFFAADTSGFEVLETGYMGDEIYIIVLQLPAAYQGSEFTARMGNSSFDCLYQKNQPNLYCSGEISDPEQSALELYPIESDLAPVQIPVDLQSLQ